MSAMIEVKAAELIGPALDWAVAKAEGEQGSLLLWIPAHSRGEFNYSTDWLQGGPLLAKYFRLIAGMVPSLDMWPDAPADLLPWSMRAIVQFELGDVVSVPAELVGGGV